MTALVLFLALQAAQPPPARIEAAPVMVSAVAPTIDDLIDENAERRGIDPLLVRTLIKHESSGNPRAIGYVRKNGRKVAKDFGLMQLRVGAATRGLKLSRAELLDPAMNVYFGVWYLADQLATCGTVAEALGAYSSGRGCHVNGYARRLLRKYRRAQVEDRGAWTPGRSETAGAAVDDTRHTSGRATSARRRLR